MNNLTNDDNKIVQPKNLDIYLMEHQKTIISAMMNYEINGHINVKEIKCISNKPQDIKIESKIGILGDKVGSGKSIVVISLILINDNIKEHDCFIDSNKYYNLKIMKNLLTYINTNLIVVPHKILFQWNKFLEHAPRLKVFVYDSKEKDKLLNSKELSNYDVVITTCVKYDDLYVRTKDIKWKRIFIDEADSIKLPKDLDFNSKFVWLITGTPSGLLYKNKQYLNNLFKKNKDWLINHLIVKNNNDYIDESFKLPIPLRITVKCQTPPELKIKEFIPKSIINMINAGNTDEAIKQLNCNEDTNENIIKVITKNISQAIINKNKELDLMKNKKCTELMDEHIKKIKNLEKVIQRLNERLINIKKKINEMNDEYCPICLDNFNKPVVLSCCKNIYCFECLTIILQKGNKCPNCKEIIEKKNIHLINNNIDSINKKNTENDKKKKIEVLLEILNNNKDGKIMVFANYPETFSKIEQMLYDNKISYAQLKGNSNTINNHINEFSEGKIRVILLNAKYFGAGLNLQMATHIIIYHRFTKELEEQIIGRAQRLGRSNQLNIYYLIHDNEDRALDENFEDIESEEHLINI